MMIFTDDIKFQACSSLIESYIKYIYIVYFSFIRFYMHKKKFLSTL